MSHSYTNIWIHGVFGTKNRQPLLTEDIRTDVHIHLREELEEKGCKVRRINGTSDHVHMLFILSKDWSIAQIMKAVKGESSHWINQKDNVKIKFSWQIGYGAFSVSESDANNVEQYIKNQAQHHRKMTFKEEYERFIQLHNLEKNR